MKSSGNAVSTQCRYPTLILHVALFKPHDDGFWKNVILSSPNGLCKWCCRWSEN